ncbi:hypothetical protein Q7C36_001433 [Tachysurus vachellii]|uniref:Uncharacterized protein n=1 Tax=Tachysurus vachellii TaxID=175792 RepID=A0AA88P3A4_TACVA|nr:hypothetical protein Q7C36_001433 [Tachysurus vachellii]
MGCVCALLLARRGGSAGETVAAHYSSSAGAAPPGRTAILTQSLLATGILLLVRLCPPTSVSMWSAAWRWATQASDIAVSGSTNDPWRRGGNKEKGKTTAHIDTNTNTHSFYDTIHQA